MCQAKIQDHWGNTYKCLLPDYSEITSITVLKNGSIIKKVKTLCKKHAKIHKKNMRYAVKHNNKAVTYLEKLIS
jgi:hypothetical protein